MSEYAGTVKVSTLWGVFDYSIAIDDPTITLKHRIKRDWGIPIVKQRLYYKGVKNQINS